MVRKLKKRELGVLSLFITILTMLSIRLAVLQLFPSEQVLSQYQNHQSEQISNSSYMILDTNGKDMMNYNKKYVIVIDKKPFTLNNYEETLEDLMALNFIMQGEDSDFNYTDVMKSTGKLYYTVSEETYNKVKKLDNIKGLYYYSYDNVDRKKAWKVSNFLSNLPKEEDIVSNSIQEEIYNNIKDNELPTKRFYLDDKAVYGKNEVSISDNNRNLQLTIDLDIENKVREVLASEKYKDFNNIGVTIMEADTGKIKAMVQKDESEANDKYTCTGKICGLGIHGTQTVEQALLNSCNDVYAAVGEKVGYVTMMDYCKKLGLFSKVLNVTAPRQNETEGIAPDIEDGMANISIGQCMTLSPLQMLGATNAIVNGGEYIKPYLLEAILDKDDNIVKEYSTKNSVHCWFTGYYKYNNKYYTVVVIVPNIKSVNDKGQDLGGSNTAAPIFSDIVRNIVK